MCDHKWIPYKLMPTRYGEAHFGKDVYITDKMSELTVTDIICTECHKVHELIDKRTGKLNE
jgi:hypothetical protein